MLLRARRLERWRHLPVARVKNLSRAMEEMKEAGYWLVGLDERAESATPKWISNPGWRGVGR